MKKKILLASIVALSLALLVAVGGSIAWLIATDDPIVNTFTPTNIDITLTESENLDFSMVPGNSISKDPKVTVDNDIKCWVFVKIDESDNLDSYLNYAIADGWTLYNTGATGSSILTANEDHYVIYRLVEAKAPGAESAKFDILALNRVVVNTTVTKDMMNALEAGIESKPTLTFEAVAVQYDNLTQVADAYAQAFPANS